MHDTFWDALSPRRRGGSPTASPVADRFHRTTRRRGVRRVEYVHVDRFAQPAHVRRRLLIPCAANFVPWSPGTLLTTGGYPRNGHRAGQRAGGLVAGRARRRPKGEKKTRDLGVPASRVRSVRSQNTWFIREFRETTPIPPRPTRSPARSIRLIRFIPGHRRSRPYAPARGGRVHRGGADCCSRR